MKLKMLSGDFVSEYKRAIDSYRRKQATLDEDFESRISSLVNRERARLEETVPIEFEEGTMVRTGDDKIGEIVGTKIDLMLKRGGRTEWNDAVQGPGQYWPIDEPGDEDIITCEGFIRSYMVKFESGALEKDWGIEENVVALFTDEFEKVVEFEIVSERN